MSKREYSLIHSDFNPKTKTNEIWNDFISDHALEEIGITHSSSTNTKKQKICPRSFHHDEYEKVILADFSDNHDDHLRKWELLLKTKFTLQQQGKKKWLEHRELRFEHFFPVEFMNDPKFVFNHIQKYGYGLAFAPTQLKQDREFILKVVQCHGSQLQFTPFTLQNDREIVLTAIKKQPHAFRFASFALRDDREFILEAICGHNGEVLSYASPTLKKDKELLLAALKHNTSLINAWSLFSFHNTDWETIFEAIKQNKKTLEAVSHDLIQNPEFMLQAVKLIFPEFEHLQVFDYSTKEIMIRIVQEFGFLLKYMSKALRSDRDIVLKAVSNNGMAFAYASKELKNDQEISLIAIKRDGSAMAHISDDLKRDKTFILHAVHEKRHALMYASNDLKGDRDVVMEAIRCHGDAIQYASNDLKMDKEMVLAAVRKDGQALQHVDEVMRSDPEIVWEAIRQDNFALRYVSEKLMCDKQFLLDAVKLGCRNILRLANTPKELANDKEFMLNIVQLNSLEIVGSSYACCDKEIMLEAVKNNGSALRFASKELKKDPELVLEALKCNGYVLAYSDELYRERMDKCYNGASLGSAISEE